MWVLNAKGEQTGVVCDVCGETGPIPVRIANVLVAEVCDEHVKTVTVAIKALLTTQPGPPDVEEKTPTK
jgi:hypothetical protein